MVSSQGLHAFPTKTLPLKNETQGVNTLFFCFEHQPWLSEGVPCFLTFPHATECVYLLINAFIQPHYGSKLLWTVFDEDEDVLGSEIHPGYRKRLVTAGVIAGLASG